MLAGELPVWFVRVFAFIFGALWGSFANVVIYRWPRELSVAWPASHCFACKTPVRAYDNVPIFAWLWLRGRCRHCGAPFSARYPLIELLAALLSTALAQRVFLSPSAATMSAGVALALYAVRFTVVLLLLITTFIDLDEMVVPWFVKWFAAVPLVGALVLPTVAPAVDLVTALAGAGLGYLGLRLLFIDGYRLLTGRAGMGLGDAELMLVIGALLGPAGVAFSLCLGSVQGLLAAGIAALFRVRIGPAHADSVSDEEDEDDDAVEDADGPVDEDDDIEDEDETSPKMKVPFVPFLALGALEYLLGADVLVSAYLRWMRGG